VQLELHQLTLRYERLRKRQPREERGLLVSLSEIGQQLPVVVIEAAALGRTGYEPRDQLNADHELKARLEEIRLAAGPLMNLGDVRDKVVPKMCLVAPPAGGGAIATRSFIPHECHASIGVFAAVSVATASILPGSPAARLARLPEGCEKLLAIEHPTGVLDVRIALGGTAERPIVERAGLLRTARLLFDGIAFPREIVEAVAI